MELLKNKKNIKLYIVILSTILIILFAFIFTNKTEAPNTQNETNIKNIILPENTNKEEIINPPSEKYKIINRSVIVPENSKGTNKIILLTIDDGPSKRTIEMMDILDRHNAKAIFFINGMHDKGYPGIIRKINERGFTVGNHTWSHLNIKREKDENVSKKEILKNSDLIMKETGKSPKFFRAPYGESNPTIRNFVKENGMLFMDWSGAAMDWDRSTEEKDIFVDNVIKNIRPGSIILIHEHPWSLANLDALLTQIENNGYKYVDPENIIE